MTAGNGATVVTLRTGRVVLRPFRPDELEAVWHGHERARRERGAGPLSERAPDQVAAKRARIRRLIAGSGRLTSGLLYLALDVDGRLVGEVDARPSVDSEPGLYEVGIDLYEPADRGRGTGTAALRALLEYLFGAVQARCVVASTSAENSAMRRVLEKLAFVPEPDSGEGRVRYRLVGFPPSAAPRAQG
jgi:RimJ/RimL family protein N-acetyltransferase